MILRSPLPRIHYYHNKWLQVKESQYLIPTYNWTLTPISNWICFVVTISPFQCTALSTWLTNRCTDPNTRLTHQLEKDVGYKVLQFIHTMKITKLLDHKTLWHTNTTASSRERWTRAYVTCHAPNPILGICDHDRHANIKPKPDINKNHLTFTKLLPKAFFFFSILVSLLKLYNLWLDIQSIYIVL